MAHTVNTVCTVCFGLRGTRCDGFHLWIWQVNCNTEGTVEMFFLWRQACAGHHQYVQQQQECPAYCRVMSEELFLARSRCSCVELKVVVMGRNLSPPQWRVDGVAGSHYRSPSCWLIRLIVLIESHPSPAVELSPLRADWETVTVPLNYHTLLNQSRQHVFLMVNHRAPEPPRWTTPPLLLFMQRWWMTARPHLLPWDQWT